MFGIGKKYLLDCAREDIKIVTLIRRLEKDPRQFVLIWYLSWPSCEWGAIHTSLSRRLLVIMVFCKLSSVHGRIPLKDGKLQNVAATLCKIVLKQLKRSARFRSALSADQSVHIRHSWDVSVPAYQMQFPSGVFSFTLRASTDPLWCSLNIKLWASSEYNAGLLAVFTRRRTLRACFRYLVGYLDLWYLIWCGKH